MKRRVGVILTAIVQVLGSILVLMFSVFMLFLPTTARRTGTPAAATPMPLGFYYVSSAMYGVFAVSGLLTALGLFRLKIWARYSTLIFAALLTGMTLLLAVVFVLMPIPSPPNQAASVSPAAISGVKAVMVTIQLCFAVLGIFWLYYFNRATTKAAFAQDAAAMSGIGSGISIAGRKVPLSIAVIAGLNLLGTAFILPMAFWTPAAMFFGIIFTGKAATLAMLVLGAIQAYVGVALLKLSNQGRLVAVALQCLILLNAATMLMLPGDRLARYLAIFQQAWGQQMSSAMQQQAVSSPFRLIMMLAAPLPVVFLYFLLTRASAFRGGNAEEVTAV